MSEPIDTPILLGILAVLIAMWSLFKSFRTSARVNRMNDRLNKHSRMIEKSRQVSMLAYNMIEQFATDDEAGVGEEDEYGIDAEAESAPGTRPGLR